MSPDPVTAQVMNTSRLGASGMDVLRQAVSGAVSPACQVMLCTLRNEIDEKRKPTIFQAERSPLKVTLLVFDGSSLMCVASAVDPLRAANRIAGETLFDLKTVSPDGDAPVTTCGLPSRSAAASIRRSHRLLVVVAGFGTHNQAASGLLSGLAGRRAARAVGGVEAGTWLVGRAGLLEGRTATTHWEDMEDFSAAFPGTDVRPDRYVIDGPVFTAGGASPTFDLMLHLIRTRLGMAVALDVASVFIYDQAKAATEAQPLVSLGRLDGYDPRLAQAIRLMESHIDPPLTTQAIARRGVSPAAPWRRFSNVDRRDAGRLLSPASAGCRAPAGGRHARGHGRHCRPHGLLLGRRLLPRFRPRLRPAAKPVRQGKAR